MYMDVFSKALIELEKYLPKYLYSLIDGRRKSSSQMDREIKESELVNQCTSITIEEIDRLTLLANKKEFKRKNKVNNLMVGRVGEISRETSAIWRIFLLRTG